MPVKQKWKTFFFDSNTWFDVVETPDKFKDLLYTHNGNLEEILGSKRSVMSEEKKHTDEMPRFGNRREHVGGKQTLGEWLKENKIDLGFLKSQKRKK
ncbi:MAG: hypothetical protein G01um101413_553 [Parcubacteria group bacterium Gr01-1014_13]|nr:MAG: hypothetical protein G01um101413_553 [Parcubacteria group bacterium Gr01-1014_13]